MRSPWRIEYRTELDRLRLVGLQGYEGNLQHVRDSVERQRLCDGSMQRLAMAVKDLRAAGHTIPYEPALAAIATVISRPTPTTR